VGQIGTSEATRWPHYDTDATIAVPKPNKKQLLHLIPAKVIVSYRQSISSSLCVRLKGTCSLDYRSLLNTGECSK